MSDQVAMVLAPKVSANDEIVWVINTYAADGDPVAHGQNLFEIEGAKAVVEVASPAAGVIYIVVEPGQEVPVGGVLGVVAPESMERKQALASLPKSEPETRDPLPLAAGARFTKTSAVLLEKHGIDPEVFTGKGLVTSAAIKEHLASHQPAAPDEWQPSIVPRGNNGKVVVLGAGLGAHQVLTILLAEEGTEVIAILDDDQAKQGSAVMGVPVMGPSEALRELVRNSGIAAAICSVSTSIRFRRKVYELARELSLSLANAIHSTAAFDDGVTIGQGNYIGPFCYLGAGTKLGDYCFLSSRTTFEHHNVVGNGVTTGPNVATSGYVTIGNHVKFGAGIVVEPSLEIGSNSVIASGCVISVDLPAETIVKSRSLARISPIQI